MKKYIFVLIMFITAILIGCGKNDEKILERAMKEVELPSNVYEDIKLISNLVIDEKVVTISWYSNSSSLTSDGIVNRKDEDVAVTLEATFKIGKKSEVKLFEVCVKKLDYDLESFIDTIINSLNLPKTTTENLNFIQTIEENNLVINFEWLPEDEAISKTGEITRGSVNKSVEIKVKITVGDYETIKTIGPIVVIKLDLHEYCDDIVLLRFDSSKSEIELLNCPITKIADDCKIFYYNDDNYETASLDILMVGLDNLRIYSSENEIKEIYIPKDFMFSEIRVGIRKSIDDIADKSTLYHDYIEFSLSKDTIVKDYINEKSYPLKKGLVTVTTSSNLIKINNNNKNYEFDKRVIIVRTDTEINITSISRGSNRMYHGDMDISLVQGKLLLVNQVDIEEYLKKVVPSEMPSNWKIEALKSQAVAARTYAYMEFYNKNFIEAGYVVDDSVQSQVYNNQNEVASTTTAVLETKGVVMFHNDLPIIAYYYSTSCGLTSSGSEVWITDKVEDEIGYLIGQNLATKNGEKIEVDTSSEESMLEFFKMINFTNPGGSSSSHRWKISLTKEQLRNTINANLKQMSKDHKLSYPIIENNEYVYKDFPDDIGSILDVYVSERGQSGVVVSLCVVTDKLTFRIINQYNIRFTIRPRDAGSDAILYTATSSKTDYQTGAKNPSILYSGFFALEWNNDTLTFFGGGNGHGVGMDQYGANYYATNGYTYEQILKIYYSNIEFKKIK